MACLSCQQTRKQFIGQVKAGNVSGASKTAVQGAGQMLGLVSKSVGAGVNPKSKG